MNLAPMELAFVRSNGLYITEKCDADGKLLNQTLRYTVTGKPEVYCSAACRDFVFFGDSHEARKRSTPKVCAYCGGDPEGKKADALFCSDKCRKRFSRTGNILGTREASKSRTAAQSNQ